MALDAQSLRWGNVPTPRRSESEGQELSEVSVSVNNVDAEGARPRTSATDHTQVPLEDMTRVNTPTHENEHTLFGQPIVKTAHDIHDPKRQKLSIRQRLQHFTWAWYTLPMSAGGLSLLIFAQPKQFPGLKTIGLVVYAVNFVIFSLVTFLMVARFMTNAGGLGRSLRHRREGFFVPTFFLSFATIITSTQRYAIPDNHVSLNTVIRVSFWIYVASTAVLAIGQYSYVFAFHKLELQNFMPTLILPIFPIMLSGTIASVIASTQPEIAAMPILIAGLTCQGLGMSVAILMYAHMIGRLIQFGLPNREHRPGLFMCVGPPAFTALALIGMANGVPSSIKELGIEKSVIRVIAILVAIFLWALSFWWLGIAVVAVVSSPPEYFHLGWFAMVFPNTGFTLATISIAKELASGSLQWVTTGMSICIVFVFGFVFVNLVRAVWVQEIMSPGRDEDVEDH